MMVRCTTQLRGNERRRLHKMPMEYDVDILRSMGYWRGAKSKVGHAASQYAAHRAYAMQPVLGQLAMIESAIKCDVMCRRLVATMRGEE